MVSLLAKIQNVPNLSTTYNSLDIMQLEAKSTSKETIEALATVKEEMNNGRMEMTKYTAAGEEVEPLARERAEVGKTVVSIIREVKNRGLQPVVGAPLSYVAVVASDTLASAYTNHRMPRTYQLKLTVKSP